MLGFGVEATTTTTTEDPSSSVDPENVPWGMYGGMYGMYGDYGGMYGGEEGDGEDDKKYNELRKKKK